MDMDNLAGVIIIGMILSIFIVIGAIDELGNRHEREMADKGLCKYNSVFEKCK